MHTNQVNARSLMADAKFYEAYSRYNEDLNRYETWDESVDRVMNMHREFYKDKMSPELSDLIDEATLAYKDKLVLGSQRALQFGGDQLLKNHARQYNCASTYIDRPRAFAETFWMLLAGCGVGFSVQKQHISKLPKIQERKKAAKTFVVEDSVEGWSDALGVLMASFFVGGGDFPEYEGRRIYFDLSLIRPKGSLISGGFKAPGPEPLRKALDKIEYLLQGIVLNGSDFLRTIDAYDILMFAADAVLSGGVRRSATICLFSYDDDLMMNAKTGNWFIDNPQRGRSNNSVMILRETATPEMFAEIMKRTREFGEPGFVFTDSLEFTFNPCLSGDTWVTTREGPKQINDIIIEQNKTGAKSIELLVDGKWEETTAKGFFKTGEMLVYELQLKNGMKIRATSNHQFLRNDDEWVELGNLKEGELLKITNNNNHIEWEGMGGHSDDGWLIGNLIGDGTYTKDRTAIWNHWEEDINLADVVSELLNESSERNEFNHTNKTSSTINEQHGKRFRRTFSKGFADYIEKKYDVKRGNKHISELLERESSEFCKGLIGGLFDADGTVWGGPQSGMYISISQAHLPTLEIAQRILSRFGIPGKIIHDSKGGPQMLPDRTGAKNLKEYNCNPVWSLRIYGRGLVTRFFELIHIKSQAKIDKFNEILSMYSKGVYQMTSAFESEIVSITPIGVEDVYDCTVPATSYFDANGIVTHNCVEISKLPVDEVTGESGFQVCNLSEINGGKTKDQESFERACRAAAILGTLQAGYTNLTYLTDVSRRIIEREALLGVSITGWMASPEFLFEEENLKFGARVVKQINKIVAKMIGINPAARTTCVKPSGNASVLLSSPSGIHGEHSMNYLRIVQMNKEQEVAQLIKQVNPYMVEESAWSSTNSDYSIAFPVVSTPNSIYKDQLLGTKLLDKVKLVQQTWIEEGTNIELCVDPRLRHNVSNTVTVPENGWDEVEKYLFDNMDYFAGVSFLADSGDKDYFQAPFTSVLTPEEIVERYGAGGIFGAGLVVDALKVFPNLWNAIMIAKDPSNQCQEALDNQGEWIRKFNKFASNYFDSDITMAEYCLKDLYIAHKWEKIQQTFKPVDFTHELKEKKYTDIDTLGAIACSGSACEIAF